VVGNLAFEFSNFLLCFDVRHPVVLIVIIIGISENQLNFIKGNINLNYNFARGFVWV
jgi:hypothetical protein